MYNVYRTLLKTHVPYFHVILLVESNFKWFQIFFVPENFSMKENVWKKNK